MIKSYKTSKHSNNTHTLQKYVVAPQQTLQKEGKIEN
jgi:hypothetical protein